MRRKKSERKNNINIQRMAEGERERKRVESGAITLIK